MLWIWSPSIQCHLLNLHFNPFDFKYVFCQGSMSSSHFWGCFYPHCAKMMVIIHISIVNKWVCNHRLYWFCAHHCVYQWFWPVYKRFIRLGVGFIKLFIRVFIYVFLIHSYRKKIGLYGVRVKNLNNSSVYKRLCSVLERVRH